MSDDERAARPAFGPSGYLPERASKRARKIVLRAPMGIHWVWGSVLAGLVVVVAGVLLLTRDTTPRPPFVDVAAVEGLPVAQYDAGLDALLVVAGGRVEAFTTDTGAAELTYCVDARTIEAPGRVWSLTGRGLDGQASLLRHPVALTADRVWVDPTRTSPGPAPQDTGATPTCG